MAATRMESMAMPLHEAYMMPEFVSPYGDIGSFRTDVCGVNHFIPCDIRPACVEAATHGAPVSNQSSPGSQGRPSLSSASRPGLPITAIEPPIL